MSIPPDELPRSPGGRGPAAGPYARPRRRRHGRGIVAFLVLTLGVGAVWWTQSEDPRADVVALTRPATYTDLADRAAEIVDGLVAWAAGAAGTDQLGAPAPVPIPVPAPLGPDGAPPAGYEESASRLLPEVIVAGPNPAYRFAAVQDDQSTPVAWSPCRPVHYVVNDDGAPAGFAETVQAAVTEVSAATGLEFVFDGTSAEDPTEERAAYLPDAYGDSWAPVLVAVADAATVLHLDGQVAGVARTFRVAGPVGVWHLVSGSVYLDRDELDVPNGPDGEPGWTPILRHELGHLVGLDHLEDPSQLMNPVTSGVPTFQAGDLTGLSILGQGACAPDV